MFEMYTASVCKWLEGSCTTLTLVCWPDSHSFYTSSMCCLGPLLFCASSNKLLHAYKNKLQEYILYSFKPFV